MIGALRAGRSLAILAGLAIAAAGTTSPAFADDKAKAIALFDEGSKAMKAGDYEQACKAFDASNRLLPDSGTRANLARCYTQLGRIALAWTLWRELADIAPTPDLRSDALAQAKKLEPRLAKYSVKVAEPVPGLAVALEGKPIDATIQVAVPIDPGTYPVEATAPGRLPWKGSVTAAEGKTSVIEVPALALAPSSGPGSGAGSGGTDPGGPGTGGDSGGEGTPGRGRRILGVVIGVAGLGGLGAGGAFGYIARSRNEDAKSLCGGDIDRCNPDRTNDAQAKVDDARSAANISTIAAIAGGAALVTGIIVYVTAPKAERRAVSLSPLVGADGTGVALSGRF